MKTSITAPTLVGCFAATALSMFAVPAAAQSMEIDYQCACKKKPTAKKDYCRASSTPTVTIKSSARGKDTSRENAAKGQCHKEYKASCPKHSCEAQVTKLGERTLSKDKQERRSNAQSSGMTSEQVERMAKYAKDKKLTVIVRSSNKKSLQYQDKSRSQYRPKPLALNALNTEKKGSSAGLIRKPSWKQLVDDPNTRKKEADVRDEINRLKKAGDKCKKDGNGDGVEDDDETQPCGWYFDNKSVIRDPKKRAVYGDYDLQGVYRRTKLLETNAHTKEGMKRLKELNKVLDQSRTAKDGVSGEHDIPIQWLIQHGANDNYKKKDGSPGRCTKKDEDFIIFEPDGNTVYLESRADLKKYYTDHKMAWNYDKCP